VVSVKWCARSPLVSSHGHPDPVDAPPYSVRGVDVIRVTADRGLPAGSGQRRGIVQSAGPQHVAGSPVRPEPAPTLLVVVPLALVDKVGEPADLSVRVGKLVELQPPGRRDPVGAFGIPVGTIPVGTIPVGTDQRGRRAGQPGARRSREEALCRIEMLPTSRVSTARPRQKSWPPWLRSEPGRGLIGKVRAARLCQRPNALTGLPRFYR
jgi:hypothetical protein